MGEQFHDGEGVESIGRGLGQEIFQSLPVVLSGPLHINFDSVTSTQSRSKSSDRGIRCVFERGSEDDRKLGRGYRRGCPALQVERNRDCEHGDVSLRSLGFESMTSIKSIFGISNFFKNSEAVGDEPFQFTLISFHNDGTHATTSEGRTVCLLLPFGDRAPHAGIDNTFWMDGSWALREREAVGDDFQLRMRVFKR